MSSDVVSVLNLDKSSMHRKFIFAIKDTSSDLNFFFADFLSFYIKKNYPIILVNLAQSYSHYTHLLMKSGVSIKVLRDPQKIAIVDLMSEAGCLINSTSQPESETTNILCNFMSDCSDIDCLKPLYETVKRNIERVCTSNPDGFILFFDEITLLMNLGVPLQAIQPFVQQCYSLCAQMTGISGSLLVGSFIYEPDVENKKLVNYFDHLADITVWVEGLKTGYSKDTHGKITMEVKDKAMCTSTYQKLFFKVNDKGAKLLTLGL